MHQLEKTANRLLRRNYAEGAELASEAKEKQTEEAEKKLAARERLEQTSREIKTTKNQIQNIIANMQQVVKAVQAIRAQLGVSDAGNIPSVERDEVAVAALRKKLNGLYGEIKDLQGALLLEERKSIQEEHTDWPAEAISQEAERRVQAILHQLGVIYGE